MKTLILFALFTGALIAAPADVQLTTIGPWPICKVFPDATFCVPGLTPNYALLVRASSPEVISFAFTIRYISGGEERIVNGQFARADADTGYSISQIFILENVDCVLTIEVEELQ